MPVEDAMVLVPENSSVSAVGQSHGILEFDYLGDCVGLGSAAGISALKKLIRFTARAEYVELIDHRSLSRYEFV